MAEGSLEEVRQAIASGEKVNSEAGSLTPLMAAASDTTTGLGKIKILLGGSHRDQSRSYLLTPWSQNHGEWIRPS